MWWNKIVKALIRQQLDLNTGSLSRVWRFTLMKICHCVLKQVNHGKYLIYHGIPLYTMIYNDIPWYTMIYHDIPWYSMAYNDIPWYTMVYYGIPWYIFIRVVSTYKINPVIKVSKTMSSCTRDHTVIDMCLCCHPAMQL